MSVPFEQADVQGEPRAVGEPLEEAASDVGAEAADPRLGEIDVRDDERRVRRLERDAARAPRDEAMNAEP